MKLSDLIIEHGPYVAGGAMPFPTAPNGHPIITADEMNELREELTAARRLREVLDALVDPDPCWFDHHGGCQAHGANLIDGRCGDAVAKELLAEPTARSNAALEVRADGPTAAAGTSDLEQFDVWGLGSEEFGAIVLDHRDCPDDWQAEMETTDDQVTLAELNRRAGEHAQVCR